MSQSSNNELLGDLLPELQDVGGVDITLDTKIKAAKHKAEREIPNINEIPEKDLEPQQYYGVMSKTRAKAWKRKDKVQLTLYLTAEERYNLKVMAAETNQTMSQVVANLINHVAY